MMMDEVSSFFFENDYPVRGVMVRLGDSWRAVVEPVHYELPVQQLLGEMLAASALMTHLIKRGDVMLQMQGNGALRLAMAECWNRNSLRGIARMAGADDGVDDGISVPALGAANAFVSAANDIFHPWIPDPKVAPLQNLLGPAARMTITIRPPQGSMHQGIVPLGGTSLAGCLQDYFLISEQLPTQLWLSAEDGIAAGLLLQRLPGDPQQSEVSEAHAEAVWSEIIDQANALTADELRNQTVSALLVRLFGPGRVRLHPPKALTFACSCSRLRSENALRLLGQEEVESVVAELGRVEMRCEFCGTTYEFLSNDLPALWAG